ncbi:hypothetical protein [Alteromonas halophila]|uniref:Uncharacterized protein n=1 Tax=Alteromonas halophila TaxID=516698 RepID=A0A918JQ65_9ALTE|nr:hypothetical protein [Alteromonas halophila]GGW92563.1 hypothetical protein GCM10007391_28680 [Alteromonas halophila]
MQPAQKRIAFHRRYHGYTGGHQKVRDYIDHFLALGWRPSLYLSNKAATNKTLFDEICGVTYQAQFDTQNTDVVFLAGEDWQPYLANNENSVQHTIINLIQHVRHAEPDSTLFSYLQYPAIRLCVSQAVKRAIEPYANGPCIVIPMGHELPIPLGNVQNDVFILANKKPELGQQLFQWLEDSGKSVTQYSHTVERERVTAAMSSARVTIALPNDTEGFYLPGIEAMWLSEAAVVPYCIANTEYSNALNNCYLCEYSYAAIQEATLSALNKSRIESRIRKSFGNRTAKKYTAPRERAALARALTRYVL